MNPAIALAIIQLLMPEVVALLRRIHGDDPKYKDYTDEDMFLEALQDIDGVVAKIDAWQATHPRVP